jgi:hypothetical protein
VSECGSPVKYLSLEKYFSNSKKRFEIAKEDCSEISARISVSFYFSLSTENYGRRENKIGHWLPLSGS